MNVRSSNGAFMKSTLLGLACACFLVGVASSAPFELGLTRNLAVGAGPSGVVVADFDRDGNLDIAVTERDIDSLSVWLGNGTGKFGTPARYPTGDLPSAIAAGDLNGDGRVDLAVVNTAGNTVTVYRGGPLGFFGNRGDYPVGTSPTGLAIGDANNDGHLDIAVANSASHTVTILVGGFFGVGVNGASFPVPTGTGPRAVALADITQDGINELITTSTAVDSISVFAGTPGGFGTRTNFGITGDPSAIAVGDLTSDGWPDLAVALSGGSGVAFYRNVNGTLVLDGAPFAESGPDAVVIAEVHGDNHPDIVVGHTATGLISVLGGVGNGTFSFAQSVQAGGSGVLGLAVADMDGDGRRDIVAPCLTPALVSVLFNNLQGPFGITVFGLGLNPIGIAAADLDGDTDLDVAATSRTPESITTYLNNGNGTFLNRMDVPAAFGPSAIVAVDLNTDSMPDLAVTTFRTGVGDSNSVSVFLNQGNGVFNTFTEYDKGDSVRVGLAAGDFTNDGKIDLVTGHRGSTGLQILAGNGLGTFGLAPPLTTYNSPTTIHAADVNANGSLDLFVGGSAGAADGRVSAFLADGVGGFAPKVDYVLDSSVSAIAHADFDEDGKVDLAAANQASGNISILRGDGLGGFTNVGTLPVTGAPLLSLLAGDFNGDGDVDLIAGRTNPSPGILYGMGDGTFAPVVPFPLGGGQIAMAAAFLDGNATLDFLVARDFNYGSAMLGRVKTKTTLTVTPNPTAMGQSLTYTATVTEAQPDSINPTGSVRFYDGPTYLGAAPLTGGVATLAQSAFLPWTREISARYVGDVHFYGSISRPVEHFTYTPNVGVPPASPVAALGLAPLANPVRSGSALRLRYDAAPGEPARLALIDIRGRVLAAREVSGTGIAELAPAQRLSPGIYLVRLEQGARSVVARAVVL